MFPPLESFVFSSIVRRFLSTVATNAEAEVSEAEIEVAGEIFKAAGYRWSQNKAAWYWHEGEYRRSGKKKYSMNDIRMRYGSTAVKYDDLEELPA